MALSEQAVKTIQSFADVQNPTECQHKHKLSGTGGVFYQSMLLLYCTHCKGWQDIRKPIK